MMQADLATLNGLGAVLGAGVNDWFPVDGAYCPTCGDSRRMEVVVRYWDKELDRADDDRTPIEFEREHAPVVVKIVCVQCRMPQILVVHAGPSGMELIRLQVSYGGLSTPHAPQSVSYYLDQAQRSEAIGALSAAVAMYRSALEQLLYDQGFTKGTLAAKIDAADKCKPPPQWLRDIHPEFLRALKDLGNAAVHPNDGDVERQQLLDRALLLQVRELFEELLDEVYELPQRRQERLEAMETAHEAFKQDTATLGD